MVNGVTPILAIGSNPIRVSKQQVKDMGSDKTKVLTVRVTSEAATAIELEAARSGKSVKEVIETFGMDISEGRLRCNGDSFVPPDEYLYDLVPDSGYERLNFGVLKDAYERCGYPAHVVRKNNEMLAAQIRDAGRFSSKRYSDDPC